MYLPKPSEGGNFELMPAGTYAGICYRVVDLGTQMEGFQGAPPSPKRKLMLSWEFPDELMSDGRPYSMHKSYTLSMHEKATLRHHLEAWRGMAFNDADFGEGGFDVRKLLGVPVMIGIVHKTRQDNSVGATISSLSKMPKAMTVGLKVNPAVYLSLDNFDRTTFDGLSDNLKATIMKSPEYQNLGKPKQKANHDAVGADMRDDDEQIPF